MVLAYDGFMNPGSQKPLVRVPTRDELYNLSLRFMILSALSMIGWVGVDAINTRFFESALDVDKVKPAFLIAFVFFLGMSYAFFRQGRITIFLKPEQAEEPVWLNNEETKQKMIDDAFRKLERPGDKKNPPSSGG